MANMAAILEHPLWVREAKTANKMINPTLKAKESQASRFLGKGPRPGQLLVIERSKGMTRRQRRKTQNVTKALGAVVV